MFDLELRPSLTVFFVRFTANVEKSVDKIYFGSSNPEIERAALMGKIYGICVMNKVIWQAYPIANLYHAWPLTKQFTNFFANGKGRDIFKSKAELAYRLREEHESRLDYVIIDMTGLSQHTSVEVIIDE